MNYKEPKDILIDHLRRNLRKIRDFPGYMGIKEAVDIARETLAPTVAVSDGKPYCKAHRVTWDQQQSSPSDKCVDCGRDMWDHNRQLVPEEPKKSHG